jgi:hypothetical protein
MGREGRMNRYIFIVTLSLGLFLCDLAIAQEEATNEDPIATPSGSEQTPPPPDPPPVDSKKLEGKVLEALEIFSFEPTLEELKRAALKYQDADKHTSRHWRTAPNRSALLPTLKFVFDHDVERDENLDRYQDEPDRWGADSDRDYGFQISAQWRLDELIFNSDEIRVWNALADRASRRESILMILVSYYFERRKLQLERHLVPPTDLMEMAMLNLRIAELTSSIDALTGGYLSRALEKNSDN